MFFEIIGWFFIFLGVFLIFTGAVGIIRMPDFFTRLHPAGVVDSTAIIFIGSGLMLFEGFTLISLKIFILTFFATIFNATACHALAKCAFFSKEFPYNDDEEVK